MPNWLPKEEDYEDTDELEKPEESEEVFTRPSRSYWTWQGTFVLNKLDPPTEDRTGT